MKYRITFLMGILLTLVGCEADKSGLSERATIEGRANSEASIQAENSNLAWNSRNMEDDLTLRHQFYQSVKGTFEGDLETTQGHYKIRITLVPSLHPVETHRVRQLEEVTSDLNNLYLNAQIVQWNPANPMSAVGCRVGSIRADITHGEITIASESCTNLYSLRIVERNLEQVDSLTGEVQPSTNAAVYHFTVNRVR